MVHKRGTIPVTVIVVTKNEEGNITRCLNALGAFAQVIVVDSRSSDRTCEIACDMGAELYSFQWNGQYPKKRQWCLDVLNIGYKWIFWVDADEVIPDEVINEINGLIEEKPIQCGFFVQGVYVCEGAPLKYGLRNNKIALFHRDRMCFPVVNDLDIEGMGEIEGHYQPVFKVGYEGGKVGQLRHALFHYAYEDNGRWHDRHKRYAIWEAEITRRNCWPKDPIWWREFIKSYMRHSFLKPYGMFVHSYLIKRGFLDGVAGFNFARSRMRYCKMILSHLKG